MIILGIETSCDETALALLSIDSDSKSESGAKGQVSYTVINSLIHSQASLHVQYGGVFPAVAKREHITYLPIVYKQLMEKSEAEYAASGSGKKLKIDRIAVTSGPGLEPALWTGIDFAQQLGESLKIPVVPVNHMEGHILASLLPTVKLGEKAQLIQPSFPTMALLISGGHTEMVLVNSISDYKILGHTVDDALGEVYDKVARMINLPYPGGPHIAKLAKEARNKTTTHSIKLPRPLLHNHDPKDVNYLNFSFSGLKTAVLYALRAHPEASLIHNFTQETNQNSQYQHTSPARREIFSVSQELAQDFALEFENAITDVLVEKMRRAMSTTAARSIIIGGGVIANTHIRRTMQKFAEEYAVPLYLPDTTLTGDNALMIACAGFFAKDSFGENDKKITANSNLSL